MHQEWIILLIFPRIVWIFPSGPLFTLCRKWEQRQLIKAVLYILCKSSFSSWLIHYILFIHKKHPSTFEMKHRRSIRHGWWVSFVDTHLQQWEKERYERCASYQAIDFRYLGSHAVRYRKKVEARTSTTLRSKILFLFVIIGLRKRSGWKGN